MSYDKIIEFDNLTISDCIALNKEENIFIEINNGRITGLIKEK